MKFFNQHKQVNLIVEESIIAKISQIGIEKYPLETGGFLVGYYSNDSMTLHIKDLLLPSKQKGMAYLFERSIDGMKQVFKKLFEDQKYFYIGEWHTHTNGSSMYSSTDLNAMIEIANCETVSITNPILLILSIRDKQVNDFSFYIYNNKGLHRYE